MAKRKTNGRKRGKQTHNEIQVLKGIFLATDTHGWIVHEGRQKMKDGSKGAPIRPAYFGNVGNAFVHIRDRVIRTKIKFRNAKQLLAAWIKISKQLTPIFNKVKIGE